MEVLYSVSNLRSLTELPSINLKPITILVGKNSAGKSTFLRSLPLLRQSIQGRSSAPILWYGDLVDFGDFNTSVRNRDPNGIITFKFEVNELEVYDDRFASRGIINTLPRAPRNQKRITIDTATIEMDVGSHSGNTIKRRVQFHVPSQKIDMKILLGKEGRLSNDVVLNGVPLSAYLSDYYLYFTEHSLFSPAHTAKDSSDGDTKVRDLVPFQFVLSEYIAQIFKRIVDKRIGAARISEEAFRVLSQSIINEETLDRLAQRSEIRAFEKLYNKWIDNPESGDLLRIKWLHAFFQALNLYGTVARSVSEVFASTNYVGPARARGERFYRLQELEVSEIAANGENLPMFLASLSSLELQKFSDWIERLFGYGISVVRSSGHISINLKRGRVSANVADTGYGVSQILPVLAQTWWITQSPRRLSSSFTRRNPISLVAMEQPELHLHPGHQARLADVFVEAVRDAKSPTHFVIETHSEALINRMGELVESKAIPAKDVQVLIFSSDEDEGDSRVSISTFDDKGILRCWPFGFFSY